MDEQQAKALDEIEKLKLQNNDINKKMVDLTDQLRLISHSYNTKTTEMTSLLFERQREI
jgi:hypothetical protein